VRVDVLSEYRSDPLDFFDLSRLGGTQSGDGPEVLQQHLDARGAEPWNFGEHRGDVVAPLPALVRDRESVRFVAQALQQVQRLARTRQDHREVVAGEPHLFEPLGDAAHGDLGVTGITECSGCRLHLRLAAVDQEQLRRVGEAGLTTRRGLAEVFSDDVLRRRIDDLQLFGPVEIREPPSKHLVHRVGVVRRLGG
jgi:hypothetical protein